MKYFVTSAVLALFLLSMMLSCAPRHATLDTADAVCIVWKQSLIRPSRSDTPETLEQVWRNHEQYNAACGDHNNGN